MKEIVCFGDDCDGIVLENGRHVGAKVVLSNATPHVTFNQLIPDSKKPDDEKSKEYFAHISNYDYTSPVTKINGKLVL